MNKSFACQKRGVRRNRYDRFSIPVRSSHFDLLNRGRVGGLFDSSLRLSAVLGFRFWGFLRMIRGIFRVFLRLFLVGFCFYYAHHKAKLLSPLESVAE